MKSIPTPTLLQYGSHSNVVSRELAARMAETMPRCTVERIEGMRRAGNRVPFGEKWRLKFLYTAAVIS